MVPQRIIGFFWFILVSASVFSVSDMLVESLQTPKWFAMKAVLIFGVLIFMVYINVFRPMIKWDIAYHRICEITNTIAFIVSALAILQYFGMIHRYQGYAIGTFDNTAGLTACLSLTFPMGFTFFSQYSKNGRLIFVLLKMTSILAISLYGSRIGLLCILLIMIVGISRKQKYQFLWSSFFLFIAFPIFAFAIKTDSTRGRWFIIQRTFDLIKEHPFSGWGSQGFMINYMNVQADYFSRHPNSQYAFLADNIHHPLNEFLFVAVNYGIWAIVLLFICISSTFLFAYRHPSVFTKEGCMLLISILLLSAFSYPFAYPLTFLILLLSIVLVYSPLTSFFPWKRCSIVCYLFVYMALIQQSYSLANNVTNQFAWKRALEEINKGNQQRAKAIYSTIYESMNTDYSFLYNYAHEMYTAKEYPLALKIAKEAERHISDYDLQLLMGDVLSVLGENENAIAAYQKASNMCPSRLTPLFEIYMLYSQQNDTIGCVRMHDIINNRHYKKMNTEVLKMLHHVNMDFKSRHNLQHQFINKKQFNYEKIFN